MTAVRGILSSSNSTCHQVEFQVKRGKDASSIETAQCILSIRETAGIFNNQGI